MPSLKRILIVEFSLGHFELFFSHLMLLKKNGYKIFYAGLEDSEKLIADLKSDFSDSIFITKPKSLKQLWKIRNFIIKNEIGQILFNSASGRSVLLLSILIGSRAHLCGVLHNIEKLTKSNTQKLISYWIRDYLTLSRFLNENALALNSNNLKFEYFYPIYFRDKTTGEREDSKLTIVIPGNIQKERRDYASLIESLKSFPSTLLTNFKIVLLGNASKYDGMEIKYLVERCQLSYLFEFFDDFLSNQKFHQIILQSDFIMPLTHPSEFKTNRYDQHKISGAFNLAFGHKKPLLIHQALEQTKEFNAISHFYTLDSLESLFKKLLSIDSSNVKDLYLKDERFNLSNQENRFFKIIQ
jgi:hypothetical protein